MHKRVFFQNQLFIKSFRFSLLFWFWWFRSSWFYFGCLLRLLYLHNFFLNDGWDFSYYGLLGCFINDFFRNSINDDCFRGWAYFSCYLLFFTCTLFLFFIGGSRILLLRFFLRTFYWLWFTSCFCCRIICFILGNGDLFYLSLFRGFRFTFLFNFLLIHFLRLFCLFLFIFRNLNYILYIIVWFAFLRFFLLFNLWRFLCCFWGFFSFLIFFFRLLFLCLLFNCFWCLFSFYRLTIPFFRSFNSLLNVFFLFRAFCWNFNWRDFYFLHFLF